MADHYYTDKPTSESNRTTYTTTINGEMFRFTTDAGVFSKNDLDFGTRVLVEALDISDGDSVLDVGCGYGPIGLYVAKTYPEKQVWMIDVNERALSLAKENAAQNNVQNVHIKKSYLFEQVEKKDFSTIISNPPIRAGKAVVHQLFEDAYAHLAPGGELWIVIQKKQGAPSALDKLASIFTDVEVVTKKKGYFIIRAKKFLTH